MFLVANGQIADVGMVVRRKSFMNSDLTHSSHRKYAGPIRDHALLHEGNEVSSTRVECLEVLPWSSDTRDNHVSMFYVFRRREKAARHMTNAL